MTTAEIIKHLKAMAAARRAMLKMTQRSMDWIDSAEVQALEAAIEIISSGKTYTAFDVIRLVQRAVSDEVCAMDANEAAIGYEIERSIIGELVKEDEHETNETGFGG